MLKNVTNEEFEQARINQDNRNIIEAVCNQYRDTLSRETLESCGLNGLWQCLKYHDDKYRRKFTTSLFQFVDWECKHQIKSQKNTCFVELTTDIDDGSLPVIDYLIVHEYLERLSINHKKVIFAKFFESKSCAEIAREMGCSRQNVTQMLDRAIQTLRSLHLA